EQGDLRRARRAVGRGRDSDAAKRREQLLGLIPITLVGQRLALEQRDFEIGGLRHRTLRPQRRQTPQQRIRYLELPQTRQHLHEAMFIRGRELGEQRLPVRPVWRFRRIGGLAPDAEQRLQHRQKTLFRRRRELGNLREQGDTAFALPLAQTREQQ